VQIKPSISKHTHVQFLHLLQTIFRNFSRGAYFCIVPLTVIKLSIGPTVYRRPQNFEPSRGICPFPRNFDIAVEFRGILQNFRNVR